MSVSFLSFLLLQGERNEFSIYLQVAFCKVLHRIIHSLEKRDKMREIRLFTEIYMIIQRSENAGISKRFDRLETKVYVL